MGGIVGVIVGILLAPKSGSETRAEFAEQSEVWRERAEEIAARVRERMAPTVDVVRERFAPVTDALGVHLGREPEAHVADEGIVAEAVEDTEVTEDIEGTEAPKATEGDANGSVGPEVKA